MPKGEEQAGAVAVEESPSTKTTNPDVEAELEALEEAEAAEAVSAGESSENEPTDEAESESADEPTAGEEEAQEETETEDEPAKDAEDEKSKSHRQPGAERRIKELSAKFHSERERAESAEKRVKEVEGLLNEGVPLPANWLTAEDAKLIRETNAEESALETEQARLMRYQGVGYTDNKDPSKSLSQEEVADRLIDVNRKLKAIQSRSARATEIYQRSHGQFMADAELGRKIREIRARKQAEQPAKRKVIAAAAGAGGRSSGRSAVAPVSRPGFNEKRFKANGADGRAAEIELENL